MVVKAYMSMLRQLYLRLNREFVLLAVALVVNHRHYGDVRTLYHRQIVILRPLPTSDFLLSKTLLTICRPLALDEQRFSISYTHPQGLRRLLGVFGSACVRLLGLSNASRLPRAFQSGLSGIDTLGQSLLFVLLALLLDLLKLLFRWPPLGWEMSTLATEALEES